MGVALIKKEGGDRKLLNDRFVCSWSLRSPEHREEGELLRSMLSRVCLLSRVSSGYLKRGLSHLSVCLPSLKGLFSFEVLEHVLRLEHVFLVLALIEPPVQLLLFLLLVHVKHEVLSKALWGHEL